MKYVLFVTLYQEALGYSDIEMYIAERGWQDWMDQYDSERLGDILKNIYYLANTPLKEIRESRKMSRVKFASIYNIPIRTVENWEGGQNKMPDYTKMMIDYTFFTNDLLE